MTRSKERRLLAVMFTLIYLARQVRHYSQGIRMATFESAVRGVQEHHRGLIGDSELLRVHFAARGSRRRATAFFEDKFNAARDDAGDDDLPF